MAYKLGFKVADVVKESVSVPAGEYPVKVKQIIENDSKKTKGAKNLQFIFEILSGQYQGRTVFAFYNHVHPNTQTVEIAYTDLGKIAAAMGKESIETTDDYIGGKLNITLVPDGEYTKIKKYAPLNSSGNVASATKAPTPSGSTGRFANRNKTSEALPDAPSSVYGGDLDDDIPF